MEVVPNADALPYMDSNFHDHSDRYAHVSATLSGAHVDSRKGSNFTWRYRR